MGCEFLINLCYGAHEEGFVEFGEFAGNGDGAVGAKGLKEVVDKFLYSVGGFEEG